MQLLICFLVMVIIGSSEVFGAIKKRKWNRLKVTWGPDMENAEYFVELPTRAKKAIKEGYEKISDCDDKAKWRGSRYVKDKDYSVVLLFDVKGFIAGIQTTVPKTETDTYPSTKLRPPFVEDGDRWAISAYFIEPGSICTKGRTIEEFRTEGTGTKLYIQKTDSPEESELMPALQTETAGTKWTEGKCFPTMGKHFWHDLRKDKPCDEMFPAFLLYNKGQLNAFGWNLLTNLPSKRYEHPQPNNYGMFMDPVPDCLNEAGTISTMHIYFTKNVANNKC